MVERSQRWILIAGIVLSGLYFFGYAGLMGFFPPPPPNTAAGDVAQIYQHDNMTFRAGVLLMLIAGAFNAMWGLVISVQMAREERGVPIWAILQGIGGVLGAVLFILPALFWAAASFSPERDSALTLLMHELAFLTFITPVAAFPLQAIPIGIVCFAKKTDEHLSAFPRWLGYGSFWMALTAEFGVAAVLFKSGPFAWNGLFPFWLPFGLFGVWLGALFFMLFRAIGRQELAAAKG